MAKKLSVAEILAAARAQKGGDAPAATPEPASPPPTLSSEEEAAAEPVAAGAEGKPAAKKPAGQLSMAEILAAARAGKSGAAAATPAAKEAPKPAAPKPAAAPKAAAPKPAAEAKPAAAGAAPVKDTASILAAARKGAKPGPITKAEAAAKGQPIAEVGKKKLDVPPMPAKPEYARPKSPAPATTAGRRSFLAGAVVGALFGSPLAIGFSSLAITHLMWLLGFARFMFPNILIEPPTRFKVGFPDAFSPGQVETKYIPQFGVWIVRYEVEGQAMIYALKSVCTHLGCTPNWLEAEQKFKCPCHGSGFYKDGVNFEGPAPRPLERYAISLADDGQLLVDKSRTFNQELGQWNDAASFVPV
jgi:cytochrome b6-f complex iron-sulfur subunit